MIARAYLCAALAVAASAAAPAAAQGYAKKTSAVLEAPDSVFSLCPNFIAGNVKIDGAEVASHGYAEYAASTDAQGNKVESVDARFGDGDIIFGGIVGKACSVMVKGPSPDAAVEAVKKILQYSPVHYALDAEQPADGEAWSGKTGPDSDLTYHLQISKNAGGDTPTTVFLIYFT